MEEILARLKVAALDFSDIFEDQRRNVAKSHGLKNEIILTSKKGIVALKKYASLNKKNQTTVDEFADDLQRLWRQLCELDLPADLAWQFNAEAGQELAEFLFMKDLYPFVIHGREKASIEFSMEDINVTRQAYLAGLGDAVGELSKMIRDYLLQENLTKTERKEIRKRFLYVAEQIYEFLDRFETTHGMIINNSRQKSYRNTFRGLLDYVSDIISRQKDDLIKILDQE